MPKHTTEKAHLERTDRGSFWRDFCAPHPQLFAQTKMGGTRKKCSRSRRGNTWHSATVPATFLLLPDWAENWRGGLMCGKALGIQELWEKWTTAHLALEHPRYLPIVTNTLEVSQAPHAAPHLWARAPRLSLTIPFLFHHFPSCPNL